MGKKSPSQRFDWTDPAFHHPEEKQNSWVFVASSLSKPSSTSSLKFSFQLLLHTRQMTRGRNGSALFRRPIRFFIPISISLAVATVINNLTKTSFVLRFKDSTSNVSLPTPYLLPSALTYFNALYILFWTVRDYAAQAASKAFYNDSLWGISVIYTQSYTVYLSAIIIPYTRPKWRLGVWTFFILTAWWVQSWAWYSISGLLLADAAIHMHLREHLVEGIPLRLGTAGQWVLHVPGWTLGLFLVLAGGTLQFFWREWRPTFGNGRSAVAQPQAREDDFLIVIGILLLLESLQWLRRVVGNRGLVAVGKRSLSKCSAHFRFEVKSGDAVNRESRLISRWKYRS